MVVVAGSHNMLSALTTSSSGVLTNNTPGVGGRGRRAR